MNQVTAYSATLKAGDHEPAGSASETRIPMLPVSLLAIGLGISAWRCMIVAQGGTSIFSILNMLVPAVVGGALCLLGMITSLRGSARKLSEVSRQKDDEFRAYISSLQIQLLE